MLPFAAFEAPPWRGNGLIVEALRFPVERGTFGDVGDDLVYYGRFLFHDLQAAFVLGRQAVPEGDTPRVLAVPVGSVQTGPRPLSDSLALVLCKRGEHLEDEPPGRVGGIYRLGRGA